MKLYEKPSIDILKVETQDIIKTSLGDDDYSGDNWAN